MNKWLAKRYILFVLLSILNCSCADLDIADEGNVYSDPSEVMDLAGDSFRLVHNIIQGDSSVALAMGAMADHITCKWENFGLRSLSLEPRVNSFNNSVDYDNFFIIQKQWEQSYKAITNANISLKGYYGGMEFGEEGKDNQLVEAFSWFVSGVSHGYLGLVFDKAIICQWDSDVGTPELRPWEEVVDASLTMLERAIEIANANTFDVPIAWVGGQTMTNIELSQLANGYAARILTYSSRTMDQNDAVDWDRILEYSQNSMDWDFAPYLGTTYGWYDGYYLFSTLAGWGRVDMRIANLMNHDFPSKWPADNLTWNTPDGHYPGFPEPGDKRLTTDFLYFTESNLVWNDAYLYSEGRYKRYYEVFSTSFLGIGSRPSFLVWEVKLLESEALFRTGDTEGALAILNDSSGPRKVRGGLPDVLPTDDILRYILDEKEIECFLTGAGVPFYDMRRTDRLQPATLLHFPVPCTELEIMRLPHYTIHAMADGVDGSAGNWTGWDE